MANTLPRPEEESSIKLPNEFVLKAFGLATTEFETAVLSICSKHIPNLREDAFSFRKSGEGKYLSITVRFTAISREQLDNLYLDLKQSPEVLTAL